VTGLWEMLQKRALKHAFDPESALVPSTVSRRFQLSRNARLSGNGKRPTSTSFREKATGRNGGGLGSFDEFGTSMQRQPAFLALRHSSDMLGSLFGYQPTGLSSGAGPGAGGTSPSSLARLREDRDAGSASGADVGLAVAEQSAAQSSAQTTIASKAPSAHVSPSSQQPPCGAALGPAFAAAGHSSEANPFGAMRFDLVPTRAKQHSLSFFFCFVARTKGYRAGTVCTVFTP